jgi:hypothetical protein
MTEIYYIHCCHGLPIFNFEKCNSFHQDFLIRHKNCIPTSFFAHLVRTFLRFLSSFPFQEAPPFQVNYQLRHESPSELVLLEPVVVGHCSAIGGHPRYVRPYFLGNHLRENIDGIYSSRTAAEGGVVGGIHLRRICLNSPLP